MAALFHDIGKTEVPSSVLMNVDSLNKAESALLHQHAEYGANLINKVKTSGADRIAKLIAQHHEYADGSGYPAGLKGTEIDYLAGILSLANSYEHLCNPRNIGNAMTPYSALAHLFSTERKKHDSSLLNVFIKMLGIYPPGSVVMLNDGSYGIVVSVNPQLLLRPVVMVYDKRRERDTPNILDLSVDEDAAINQCIHASQLPADVAEYLQCRPKLSYYFRHKSSAGELTAA
jgi:HD-GYP domain-containing protein (c-di-GMP phosphodiesterase class II)